MIIGPGAMGTLLGYILYRAGFSVDFIYKNISRREIECVLEWDGEKSYKSNIFGWSDITALDRYNYIIVATKAYDVIDIANQLSRFHLGNTYILSIQNGIGPYEYLMDVLGVDRVIPLVITYGSTKLGPCRAVLRGVGDIFLGSRYVEMGVLKRLEDVLKTGGLNTKIVDDIDGYRWLKNLVNSGINPVTVIYDAPNRVVYENPAAREVAISVVEEGVKVVEGLGIELPKDPVETMFEIAMKTRDNISSMLQDVRAGRKTEIDYINGAIVKYGEKLNIKTPINSLLVRVIRRLTQ